MPWMTSSTQTRSVAAAASLLSGSGLQSPSALIPSPPTTSLAGCRRVPSPPDPQQGPCLERAGWQHVPQISLRRCIGPGRRLSLNGRKCLVSGLWPLSCTGCQGEDVSGKV